MKQNTVKKVTINHKLVYEDLIDFEVVLNHPDMIGLDIKKATDLDGKELKLYTPKNNKFCRAIGWSAVIIPKLSCKKDTSFYIYY